MFSETCSQATYSDTLSEDAAREQAWSLIVAVATRVACDTQETKLGVALSRVEHCKTLGESAARTPADGDGTAAGKLFLEALLRSDRKRNLEDLHKFQGSSAERIAILSATQGRFGGSGVTRWLRLVAFLFHFYQSVEWFLVR